LYLAVQLITQVRSGQRSYLHILFQRSAHGDSLHPLQQASYERFEHGFHNHEALGGDTALAAVEQSAGYAGIDGCIQVGVFEHQVCVAAAELEDCFFQFLARPRGDRPPGGSAARQGDRRNVRIVDHIACKMATDQQGGEDSRAETRVAKQLLYGQGAAGHVGGVLQKRHLRD